MLSTESCKHTNVEHLPGKRCLLPSISANIHPTDHISTADPYSTIDNMISGALYHRVATYWVIKWLGSSGFEDRPLAIPEIRFA